MILSVPIYEIWVQATRSATAGTVFVACFLVIALISLNACQEVAARLTWAFARDNALIGSSFMAQVDKKLKIPVWALVANSFVIFILGCIYLGSTAAFNAFVSVGLILQQVSFAIPAALLLYHKRSNAVLPKGRYVRLGPFGVIANLVTVLFAILITIFYCFPTELPVTGSNMSKSVFLLSSIAYVSLTLQNTIDYSSAVIGVMGVFAVINWFIHSRGKFHGPRLEGAFHDHHHNE